MRAMPQPLPRPCRSASATAARLLLGALLLGGTVACAGPGGPLPPQRAGESAVVDRAVEQDISDRWKHAGIADGLQVNVTAGKAVLTGRTGNPDLRLDAVRLAWQAPGVAEVINEIQVTDQSSLGDSANDLWITTRLRSRLLLDEDIASANFTIETINGIVHLIGRARSENEKNKVLQHAREVPRVRRVVDHVIIR